MKIANILSIVLGVVLSIIAIRWIVSPEISANSLGMELFEGTGRNTQIRDFTGIFLSTSIFCFISALTKQYQWIFSSGLIFLIIASVSILASSMHDAPLTYSSLIAEILFAVLAFTAAYKYKFN
jgi:hypothetical protein